MKELYHLARCWAIEPDFLSNLSNMTKEYQAGLSLLKDGQLQKTSFVKIRGDIAIISLQGIITPRMDIFTYFMGGTPLDCLARDFQTAIDDDNIKGILFDIDSPGGIAVGPAEMAEIIFKARQIKPVWSYVGRNCCSAAYWLAAATEKIITHQSALLGSIGVVTTVPVQESPDQSGYKNIEIVSSNAKNKRPDPRTPEGINEICRELNELESQFINAVANFRDLTIDQIKNDFGQGGVLIGAKAVQIKMADMLGTYESAIAALSAEINTINDEKGVETMSEKSEMIDKNQITADFLRRECPEIVNAFIKEGFDSGEKSGIEKGQKSGMKIGADNERARLQAIEEISMPGHESLIAEARKNPDMTAEKLALQMIAAEKAQGGNFIATLKNAAAQMPAIDSGANVEVSPVRSTSATVGTPEEKAEALWKSDANIRQEFANDKEAFIAYFVAAENGQVKIHNKV